MEQSGGPTATATVTVTELTPAELHRFNGNGRLGPKLFAMDGVAPVLVRIDMSTTWLPIQWQNHADLG
ncbi:hypothetical protein AB0M45_04075 [Nocardia sp. NPDC051787]|uniref:hypothetical protein n=1 Tax=Nocardia sp. NPDC051787 TaxID=3155415 RepID=UPI00342BAA17